MLTRLMISRAAHLLSCNMASNGRVSPRHTTQEQPFEVVVQYPHHPRAGERVIVLRRVIHGARVHFVIEQPDGCRVFLPAWMTERYAETLQILKVPRLWLESLRELRSLIDAQSISSSLSPGRTLADGAENGQKSTMAPIY